MKLQGIDAQESILVPSNAEPLRNIIDSVAIDSQKRRLVPDIEKSMLSIEHKLNIARYNGGLIRDLDVKAYMMFRYSHMYPNYTVPSAKIRFKDRCEYTITDLREYRLFLSFFIEAFAAASFSLLDVCAYLLKDLYELQFIPPKGGKSLVSFHNALKEANLQASPLYAFLKEYDSDTSTINWITPLRRIRHTTTHRSIVQVCRLPPDSEDGSLYEPVRVGEFLLFKEFFPDGSDKVELKAFVAECFDGLEAFVENLYDKLRQEIENKGSLPLT